MGVADSFKGAGLCAKIALVLLPIAALFAWIAFTCPGWGEDNKYRRYYGLWRICSDYDTDPICIITDGWANEWWGATQAFVSIGFFGINVSLVLLLLYIFAGSCQKNREVAVATTIICFATGVAYLIGVIVFGAEFKDKFIDAPGTDHVLGYCVWLSIVALILEIVAGIFVFLDSKMGGAPPQTLEPGSHVTVHYTGHDNLACIIVE